MSHCSQVFAPKFSSANALFQTSKYGSALMSCSRLYADGVFRRRCVLTVDLDLMPLV